MYNNDNCNVKPVDSRVDVTETYSYRNGRKKIYDAHFAFGDRAVNKPMAERATPTTSSLQFRSNWLRKLDRESCDFCGWNLIHFRFDDSLKCSIEIVIVDCQQQKKKTILSIQ